MDLKKELVELEQMADKGGSKGIANLQLAAKMMAIQAHVADDKVEIPADAFDGLSPAMRKIFLQGGLFILMSALND